jgi:hypothetical protein
MVSIAPPKPLTCISLHCYFGFLWRVIHYGFVLEYHRQRVKYAEKHRDGEIPERYRTGEPSPTTVKQAAWEILKLRLWR